MNRRNFLKKIGLLFCSIPFLGLMGKDQSVEQFPQLYTNALHRHDFRRVKIFERYGYSGSDWRAFYGSSE